LDTGEDDSGQDWLLNGVIVDSDTLGVGWNVHAHWVSLEPWDRAAAPYSERAMAAAARLRVERSAFHVAA
jgi:hypothetical protein